MYFSSRKIANTIFVIGVIAFFFVGFLGVTNFGMDMGMSGMMFHCPFANGMSLCDMSPFEHMATWQSMFTSLPRQQDIGSLFLLLLVCFLLFAWKRYRYPPSKNLVRQFLYVRYKEYIPLGNFLQEAFSKGILNPKLF